MKLTVLQEDLTKALGGVLRTAAVRPTLPILAFVLLQAQDDLLTLSSTNLETGTVWQIPAEVEEPGEICAPARTLAELVNTFNNDKVELDLDGTTLMVACGTARAEVRCLPVDGFPQFETDFQPVITVPVPELKEAARKALISISGDEDRPVLACIHFAARDNLLYLLSADGFRASKVTLELEEPKSFSILILGKAVSEALRMLNKKDKTITIAENKNSVAFQLENRTLIAQRVAGNYPDLDQVIPASHKTKAVIPLSSLLTAIRQAEVFARDGSYKVKLNIHDSVLEVTGMSEAAGQTESTIPISHEGDPLEISFRTSYLKDALEVMGAPNVVFLGNLPLSPGILEPFGENHFKYVVMPLADI